MCRHTSGNSYFASKEHKLYLCSMIMRLRHLYGDKICKEHLTHNHYRMSKHVPINCASTLLEESRSHKAFRALKLQSSALQSKRIVHIRLCCRFPMWQILDTQIFLRNQCLSNLLIHQMLYLTFVLDRNAHLLPDYNLSLSRICNQVAM